MNYINNLLLILQEIEKLIGLEITKREIRIYNF